MQRSIEHCTVAANAVFEFVYKGSIRMIIANGRLHEAWPDRVVMRV